MGAVKGFEHHGVFWRPAASTHRVPGTIEMTEDSLDLTVTGNLHPFEAEEVVPGVVLGGGWEWVNEPILYGRLDSGKDVTLLGAGGLIAPTAGMPFVHVRESYRVQAVCFGGHAAADAFDAGAFRFDTLEAWAQPPWLVSKMFESEFHVQHGRQVLGSTSWRELEVALVANGVGTFGPRRVSMDRRVTLEVAGPVSSLETVFNGWIRPFQSLLMVSLGTGCEITDVSVTGTDLDGERITFDVRLRLPAARPGHKPESDTLKWPHLRP